jgi:nitrogen fixation-related uncharacterized protein
LIFMTIPLPALVLLGVAACGAALALAGFVWAVGTGQMDPHNSPGDVIFDADEEPRP